MTIRHVIRKETYFDSVTLMQITNEVKKLQGVENAVVELDGTKLGHPRDLPFVTMRKLIGCNLRP